MEFIWVSICTDKGDEGSKFILRGRLRSFSLADSIQYEHPVFDLSRYYEPCKLSPINDGWEFNGHPAQ